MADSPRIFTLAEATYMLPWLRERLLQLRTLKQERDAAIRRLAGMTPAMRSNGSALEGARLEEQIDELAEAMRPLIEEIIGAGVEIKDIDQGLVDFPALRGGRVIYLCWLVSEPAIAYWHELDAGFAGRQALEE
jgi:hypothetical protein